MTRRCVSQRNSAFGLVVTAILVCGPASAATISPPDAASHVGQNVTLEGVATIHVSRGATFIDIGGKYPGQPFALGLRGQIQRQISSDVVAGPFIHEIAKCQITDDAGLPAILGYPNWATATAVLAKPIVTADV
jgi:hypothetical protein